MHKWIKKHLQNPVVQQYLDFKHARGRTSTLPLFLAFFSQPAQRSKEPSTLFTLKSSCFTFWSHHLHIVTAHHHFCPDVQSRQNKWKKKSQNAKKLIWTLLWWLLNKYIGMLHGGRGFSCNKHEQIKLKVMTASLKNCKPSSVFTAQQYTKVSKQSSTAN